MKILLLGDVHGQIDKVKEIVNSVDCDFVLQVGDLGLYSDFSKPFYFITGNHENWDIIDAIDKGRVNFENLKHIKTGEVVLLRKNNDAVRVSGLNGNYSPKCYETRRTELEGDRRRHFVRNDIEKCKKLRNIDIFLTHEPPTGIDFVKRNEDIGIKPIREILDTVKPKFLFFGHHHIFFEKRVNKTKIFGLNYARKEYCILDFSKGEVKRVILGGNHETEF